MKIVKPQLSLAQAVGVLLGALAIAGLAARYMNHVIYHKYSAGYWVREFYGLQSFLNTTNVSVWVAALLAVFIWYSSFRLLAPQLKFNAIVNSLVLIILAPATVAGAFLSFVMSLDWDWSGRGDGGRPELLLLAIVIVIVGLSVLLILLNTIPEFNLPKKVYASLWLISLASLLFMVIPGRNQKLIDVSDDLRQQRAVHYLGRQYLAVYSAISGCDDFIDYAGTITRFVPSLQGTNRRTISINAGPTNSYSFWFEGTDKSGLIAVELTNTVDGPKNIDFIELELVPVRDGELVLDWMARDRVTCPLSSSESFN